MARAWLTRVCPKKFHRFVLVSIPLSVGNAGLFILLVGCGLGPVAANLCRTGIMTEVSFGVQRRVTWKEERRATSFWQQWRRYHVVKILLVSPVSHLTYITLFSVAQVHYMAAYVLSMGTAGVANFCASRWFVYRVETTDEVIPA